VVERLRGAAGVAVVVGLVALLLVGAGTLLRLLIHHPAISSEVLGAVVVASSVVAAASARLAPRVAARTVLELDLTSFPAEAAGRRIPVPGGRSGLTLSDTVATIERAARDRRVKGLVLRPRFGAAPAAGIEELRDALHQFRAAGKFTVAVTDTFGEGAPGNGTYWLAAACEKVILHPTGEVVLAALAVEPNFYRGLLDRVGVELEVLARYEYKSAASQLTERRLTDPDRLQHQRMLDSLWTRIVDDIASDRHLTSDRVRELGDRPPLLAQDALEAGLVDRLQFTDEALSLVKDRAGDGSQLLYLSAYKKRAGRDRSRRTRTAPVAVIHAVGQIIRSSELPIGLTGGPVLSADKLIAQIRAVAKDKKTKAVVLRVDSPGGSAIASDSIWRELVRLREAGKSLVVSMGSVAASGGYYIAAPAERIVAEPGTITGSIGVVSVVPRLAAAKAKLDITFDEVRTGTEPALSVNRPMTPGQRQRLEAVIDSVYATFTARVAEGRNLPIERVGEIARGRVWTGADAHEIGLVDELGGLHRAMALALELSGAPAGTRPRPRSFPRRAGVRAMVPDRAKSSDDVAATAPWGIGSVRHAISALAQPGVLAHLGWDPRSSWIH